ncbi:MAG: mycofactocin biosynthesis peptidyl-dipeptidase MftE [Pseudoclavibacter sp.]
MPPSAALVDRVSHESRAATVVVPLGSTEQHGPHLPLDTDTVIAAAVAERIAQRLRRDGEDAAVAPAIAFGASGEHDGFAGTVSIGADALATVLVELARSVSGWARRIVIVNAHGGNVPTLRRVQSIFDEESRRVTWVACEPGAGVPDAPGAAPGVGVDPVTDLHAGRTETSLMLHLAPDRVRLDAAEPGALGAAADVIPALMRGGVAAVSPNGVLGDPRGASSDEGAVLFESMVERACAAARRAPARTGGAAGDPGGRPA